MTEYHLIRRPSVSNFMRILKRWKLIVSFIIILLIMYFLINKKTKIERLKEIYKFQESIKEVLNLEIKYMAKRMTPEYDKWTEANNIDGHIYSSYLDTRPEIIINYNHQWKKVTWAEIRIIAILPNNIEINNIECIFKYETNQRNIIYKKNIITSINLINENWNLKYSAAFIICDLSYLQKKNFNYFYDVKQLPESIGIQAKNNINSNINFIDIHYPKYGIEKFDRKYDKFMAVCVPVFDHKFNRPLELIEFIEYYKLMGVDHFTFYNSSITSDVNRVLEHYKYNDYLYSYDILNWTLPSQYIYEQTLRKEGLFAALNDCLYRHTIDYNYRYTGVFDIDEFLVPKKYNNFNDLMNYLDDNKTDNTASFLFRNVYFYTMYEDRNKQEQPYLYTRAKTKRLKKPHEPRDRSRYIVQGQNTVEIGNYNTWKLRDGSLMNKKNYFNEISVDPEVALLHHYAPCEAEETGCYLKGIIEDNTAQRFSDKLGQRVTKICSIIYGEKGCPLPVKRFNGS